jgi:hypothetical protein
METYLHTIEYLVQDASEIGELSKIIDEIPIDIPFHTTIILEPNRLPRKYFPFEMIMYIDKKQERLKFEEYSELKKDAREGDLSFKEVFERAIKIDRDILLNNIKTTTKDDSCKIFCFEGPEGLKIKYGDKKVFLTFWQGAYSDIL